MIFETIYQSQYSFGKKIETPFGSRYLTYADFIASGQPLRVIEEYIQDHVLPVYANTHTEASFTGLQTTHFREEARQIIKDSVNANDQDALIFYGSGSTGAIDKLFHKMIQLFSGKPTTVFIGPYEHHSNVLPWRESEFELIEVPITEKGAIDIEFLQLELEKRQNTHQLIGSFSAASNVTGVLTPVDTINKLLKKYGALTLWDYAGGAPYMHIDMNPGGDLNKDAIFISPHKLVGGPGTPGLLIAKKSLLESTKPVVTGGGTVQFVSKWGHGYIEDIEAREEGGTPEIIGAIRAGLAFQLKEKVGARNIELQEEKFKSIAFEYFKQKKNIRVLGGTELDRLAFFSLQILHGDKLLHHNYIVALLNDLFGIQVRGGCSCAGPYGHDLLAINEETSMCYTDIIASGQEGFKPGWFRFNLNYFIPEEEVHFILQAINWIADHGWKLMHLYHFDVESGLWSHNNQNKIAVDRICNSFLSKNSTTKEPTCDKPLSVYDEYLEYANELLKNEKNESSLQELNFSEQDESLRWFVIPKDVTIK
jgi:selenocysteine lyase/cysteine desulfurase